MKHLGWEVQRALMECCNTITYHLKFHEGSSRSCGCPCEFMT